jgi:hypothetical protein
MRTVVVATFAASLIAIAGCANGGWEKNEWFLHRKGVAVNGPQSFQVCHSYGCERKDDVALSEREWQVVRARFATAAATPDEERRRIAAAVGDLERIIGAKIGTSSDRGGTFTAGGGTDQLDCVDETVNTTVFLTLMERDGLLTWHHTRGPAGRGTFIGSWPHQTAVVTEIATGREYAIDSWFHDNGVAAEVVPLEAWYDGWSPKGFKDTLL